MRNLKNMLIATDGVVAYCLFFVVISVLWNAMIWILLYCIDELVKNMW